jgi:peroxiredoxin
MDEHTRAWLRSQLMGLIVILMISTFFALGVNMIRRDPLPWIYERKMLRAGDMFPFVPVPAPGDPIHRKYLGLPPGKEMVTIADVQADLLVLEILNVYCFPCQSQALALNDVYKLIEMRPHLKGRIKILGVAFRNTMEQVREFIKEYGILFPVMPDPEGNAEALIGPGIYTPLSLYIRRNASGTLGLIIGTHEGPVEDRQVLFDGLVTLLMKGAGAVNFDELFKKVGSSEVSEERPLRDPF